MDIRLQSTKFRDCLRSFLSGGGTGTVATEAELAQQLSYMGQESLYGIFIDLCKTYGDMD